MNQQKFSRNNSERFLAVAQEVQNRDIPIPAEESNVNGMIIKDYCIEYSICTLYTHWGRNNGQFRHIIRKGAGLCRCCLESNIAKLIFRGTSITQISNLTLGTFQVMKRISSRSDKTNKL